MEENYEKQTGFKAVKDQMPYKKSKSGFGKSFLLPFISGALGCSLVIGTCFGVPSIKSKLFDNTSYTRK